VETPSFTFRLERVRSLRARAEDQARENLANELQLRLRGESLLMRATETVSTARDTGLDTVTRAGTSGTDLIAAQAWMERAEQKRREAAHDLDRQDAQVDARRAALTDAMRDREVIDRLKERRRADHDREMARRAQIELDEIAIGMHRRGGMAAA
jgi:flagellar protein FliJ